MKDLIKKIKDDINGKLSRVHGMINIVKMPILPQTTYRLNTIPINIPMALFIEIKKKSPKIHMETQKAPNSQSNLEKKE